MQEISSHAFNRNDWLCLYLSLAFAVLERCVPTFLCGRKRWFKNEVVIIALNVMKHFYYDFDYQILEHNSESFFVNYSYQILPRTSSGRRNLPMLYTHLQVTPLLGN